MSARSLNCRDHPCTSEGYREVVQYLEGGEGEVVREVPEARAAEQVRHNERGALVGVETGVSAAAAAAPDPWEGRKEHQEEGPLKRNRQ